MYKIIFKFLLLVGIVAALIGSANSFSINSGDSQGQASIASGSIAIEGCNADVQIDINGGDRNGDAEFDAKSGDFVIQSIAVDATRDEGRVSNCVDRTGNVWLQLMSGGEAYGQVLGPESLVRGQAQFENFPGRTLLAGDVTDVHILIEMEQ